MLVRESFVACASRTDQSRSVSRKACPEPSRRERKGRKEKNRLISRHVAEAQNKENKHSELSVVAPIRLRSGHALREECLDPSIFAPPPGEFARAAQAFNQHIPLRSFAKRLFTWGDGSAASG